MRAGYVCDRCGDDMASAGVCENCLENARGLELLERQAFDATRTLQRRVDHLFGFGIAFGLCIGVTAFLLAGWIGVAIGAGVGMLGYAWITR